MRLLTLPNLDKIYEARLRLEKRTLRRASKSQTTIDGVARELEALTEPQLAWTMRDHMRAMRLVLRLAESLGAGIRTTLAFSASEAVAQSLEQFAEQWAAMSRGKSKMPSVDAAEASAQATEAASARIDVSTQSFGAYVANPALAESYTMAVRGDVAAAVATATVVARLRKRIETKTEEIVSTEIAASANLGTEFVGRVIAKRAPLKKVWDGTLDRRVCRVCRTLHRMVVPWDSDFPGGLHEPPAHPRCRCVMQPWLDDWTTDLEAADVAPGPRTGVQATAETIVPWRL